VQNCGHRANPVQVFGLLVIVMPLKARHNSRGSTLPIIRDSQSTIYRIQLPPSSYSKSLHAELDPLKEQAR
jgi:hypothetical protein